MFGKLKITSISIRKIIYYLYNKIQLRNMILGSGVFSIFSGGGSTAIDN
jgi:hypothetical protein